jgi:beta-lactamase superfamily II metal-dependent hydrolase
MSNLDRMSSFGHFTVGFALASSLALSLVAGKNDGRLDIWWCDSDGGGSTLIVTPAGESILIDSGNPGGRDSARILKVLTQTAGLNHLDHLVVTHLHIDHFGGAAEIAAQVPVKNLWDNGLTDADPDGNRNSTWPLTSKAYRTMPVGQRHRVEPGLSLPLTAGKTPLSMRCVITRQKPAEGVFPDRKATGTAPVLKAPDTSDNANSSAWILSFGNFRFFDGGDLTWNAETQLIWPQIRVPEVDLYQVTHHGLDVSNHPRLLAALNPTVTVMNNGSTKGTAGEVLATLRGLPRLEAQYQLHRNLRPDGVTNNIPNDFIANIEAGTAHPIHCAVLPDGSAYSITLPAASITRTYTTRRH